MTNPLWTYPEGHEPEWLDWSTHSGADRDPQLRMMELQAELRNNAVEVWFLRVLCLVLAMALVWVLNTL
jgi:hypothetical protein